MKKTITKEDLINVGFKPGTSTEIIRRAKCLLVQDGYDFYANTHLGRVPVEVVERIIGYNPLQE